MKNNQKNHKANRWFKLIFFIYTFILSIEIIKKSTLLLAPDIKEFFLLNLNPIKAVSAGWFATSIVQSSGAVSSVAASFAGNNIINIPTVVYILIGALLGTTITALIISLITAAKQRRDFRHGFEIGLSHSIYAIFLLVIVSFLEYFFQFFSKIALFLAPKIQGKLMLLKVPDLVSLITNPIINPIFAKNHSLFLLLLGFAILIFTLKYLGKAVIGVLGGEDKARGFINKYFDSKYKAYLIGVLLTAIVFSSSITIGLLVPLAVSRLINLKKAIPFILGANVGTFTDVFLVSIIIGKMPALATAICYLLMAIVGTVIFFPNINFLHKTTKYVSKKLIHISRKKALYILIAFILIPLLLFLLL